MKACNQKKCLHYDSSGFGNCDNKTLFNQCDVKNYQSNRVITQKSKSITENHLLDLLYKWIEKHRQLEKYCLYERNNAVDKEKKIRYDQRAEDSFHLIHELQQIIKKINSSVGK